MGRMMNCLIVMMMSLMKMNLVVETCLVVDQCRRAPSIFGLHCRTPNLAQNSF